MRTVGAGMATMLASREHTRARCLWIQLYDGSTIGMTDHDRELEITVMGDTTVYRCDVGIMPSDIVQSVGMDADTSEITGPLSALISKPAILGRKFTGAKFRIFDVNWNNLGDGIVPLMGGRVGEARIIGSKFSMELRSRMDVYNQAIGRILSPICSADFGDQQCGKIVEPIEAEVTAVANDFQISVDSGGAAKLGTVEFVSGTLGGTRPAEIYAAAGGNIEFFAPLSGLPSAGDQVLIRPGCSKLHHFDDDPELPTCMYWENALRFRGFKDVPGSDQYLKMPIPGEGSEPT